VDSPDVRVPQTERQRHSSVTSASACTYSVSPFLFASLLKHCLSLASLFPLILLLFLSFFLSFFLSSCPTLFFFLSLPIFYPKVFILSFYFHLLNLFLNVIKVSSLFPFLYSSFSLSFLNSFSYF